MRCQQNMLNVISILKRVSGWHSLGRLGRSIAFLAKWVPTKSLLQILILNMEVSCITIIFIHLCPSHSEQMLRLAGAVSWYVLHNVFLWIALTVLKVVDTQNKIIFHFCSTQAASHIYDAVIVTRDWHPLLILTVFYYIFYLLVIFYTFRCNDVLELVQTTRHFRLLADAAAVGGAGSQSLDALVKEIDGRYNAAMQDFFDSVNNVLEIDGTQDFEKSFFSFRSVVKVLFIAFCDLWINLKRS